MTGIVKNSLPNGRALSAQEALDSAAAMGLDGLLFSAPFEISDTLDVNALKMVARDGEAMGIAVSAMLGIVNPTLPGRDDALIRLGGSLQAGLRVAALRTAEVGFVDPFFIIGMIEDRFHPSVSWASQLEGVARLLESIVPDLRRHGARLTIKTHEEITTSEIAALVERIGPDVLGISFDPVNVLCRLEDPVAAARRIAPACTHIHIDDAVLRYEPGGEIRRYLAPYGEGVLDWKRIFEILPGRRLWIEMHAGQFAMPVFDPGWLGQQPDVPVAELARIMAFANSFGTTDIPWDQNRPHDRLQHTLDGLQA